MLSRITAAAVCAAFLVLQASGASAVGVYTPGKEQCNCSPMVARGVYPDTLNLLHEAFVFPSINNTIDRIAVEVKSLISQFSLASAGRMPATKAKTDVPLDKPRTKAAVDKGVIKKTDKKAQEKKPPDKKPIANKSKEKKPGEKKLKPPAKAL
ncbi:MAG: hypothetical protein V2B18_13040 [Pseudomonadota bacterium]